MSNIVDLNQFKHDKIWADEKADLDRFCAQHNIDLDADQEFADEWFDRLETIVPGEIEILTADELEKQDDMFKLYYTLTVALSDRAKRFKLKESMSIVK